MPRRINYEFIDPDNPHAITARVIRRGGTKIRVPLFWIYLDTLVYFEDGYIETKTVVFNGNSAAFVTVGTFYLGQDVRVRLKKKLPYKIDMTRYI